MGNVSSLYELFDLALPVKMKVAEYLLREFEKAKFDFSVVDDEQELQDLNEMYVLQQLEMFGGERGQALALKMR